MYNIIKCTTQIIFFLAYLMNIFNFVNVYLYYFLQMLLVKISKFDFEQN
jgi:hypothetical protein